jgi:uncharacterized HAD superfamily protein
MNTRKKIRIGFDLDGVIIGKPPFIPQFLLEALVREHKNRHLSYRFPDSNLERMVRVASHYPLLRPPIRKNIKIIKELNKSNNYSLYVVSSRYSFLEDRTKQWFRFYRLRKFFKEIHTNLKDEQPHLYKEKMIKKLKLNVFIDDDLPLLGYLRKRLTGIDLVHVDDQQEFLTSK